MNFLGYFRKLRLVVLAQLYGQATTIGVQLLLVPVLIAAWGVEVYGVWLLVSALPLYISLTDLGLTFVAKNEMTISVARDQRSKALETYQTVFVSLLVLSAITVALFGILVYLLDFSSVFNIGSVPVNDALFALILLSLNALFYQYLLLDCAAVRCVGRPATEVAISTTARLLDGIIIGTVAIAGGGMLIVAISVLVFRIVFNFSVHLWLRSKFDWIFYGINFGTKQEFKRIVVPALSMVMANVSNLLMIQGPIVVLGAVATPKDIAVFSVLRTLARTGCAAANVFSHATAAEYSTLYGRANWPGFFSLFYRHLGLLLGVCLIFVLSMGFFSEMVLDVWSRGSIEILQPLFFLLVIAIVCEMIYTSLFYVLTSVSAHSRLATVIFVFSLICAVLFRPVIDVFGLNGLGWLQLFYGLGLLVVAVVLTNNVVQKIK